MWPGSHCPDCKAPIRPWDNIPLLSYVLLRGRCRACAQPISLRYPLVEAGLAALFYLVALHADSLLAWVSAATFCFLVLGLLVMDAETFLLPDSFTLPGIGLGLVQSLAPGGGLATRLALGREAPFPLPHWSSLTSSLIGALSTAAFLLVTRWVYRLVRKREGLGLGDVKLVATLGAWLGLSGALLSLTLGILLAAGAGLLLVVRHRGAGSEGAGSGSLRLPLGTCLCVAALLTFFEGDPLLKWYFNFWR